MKVNRIWVLTVILALGVSCNNNDNFVPKPHAYPKMILPQKSYQKVDFKGAPYQFEIPDYGVLTEDERNSGKYWYNVNFPSFDATLHLTYYPFKNWEQYDSMVADTRSLVNKHIQKAEDIIEDPLENYNPSCPSCNIQKNSYTLEQFRDNIKKFVNSLNQYNTQYKFAKRYGLVKETEVDVAFYFEQIKNK